MTRDTLIFLGAGYLARFFSAARLDHYTDVRFTSRCPDAHLSHIPSEQRLQFDLHREDTWKNIPHGSHLLWSFPAAPVDAVRRFAAYIKGRFRRLVVLGSTSAYDVNLLTDTYPPPWIDETTAIDLNKPRVQGEELLRNYCAAVILRVAGIYGPGRHPFDWITQGRVGPSRKYVNLIHVEDLATICLIALDIGIPGEVYNVSDGVPRTWMEICRHLSASPTSQAGQGGYGQAPGKRINNAKLLAMLREAGMSMRHSDLFASLRAGGDV